MQTRMGSFVEAWANILVGFGINYAANLLVLPWFGFHVTAGQAFGIGLIFTAISLARSYVLRRWFNGLRFGHAPPPPTPEPGSLDALRIERAGAGVAR
jgi:hypothetical protein